MDRENNIRKGNNKTQDLVEIEQHKNTRMLEDIIYKSRKKATYEGCD